MPQQLQVKSYFPADGLNSDTNSLFVKDTEFTGVNNLRVKPNQISTRNGCRQYGLNSATHSTPHTMLYDAQNVLHFHSYKVPNGQEYYFAFTNSGIYQYTTTGDKWVSVLDGGVTPFSGITLWSTTDIIDETLGATIVAAGSIPTTDIAAENDASSRVLLYFDTTNLVFKTLGIYENLDVVDEDTSIKCDGLLHQQTVTYTLSKVTGGNTLYPGSFILATDQLGTIAYSDATPITFGGSQYYPLIPVDQTRIASSTTKSTGSFIKTDGTEILITWLTTDYADLKLKVSYTYQKSSGIKPRYVKGYYNRLLMASTYESDDSQYFPWRVRWGEIGKINLLKYSSYQDLIDTDVSPIVSWEEQGFYLTILKRQCLYKVSHVGGDLIFLFQVAWKHGSPSGRTLKNFNSTQYFLGEDDVYKWDGNTLVSITLDQETGNYRVKNAIMGMITFSNALQVFGSLDLVNKEYWLFIPETTQSTVFVYSISYNTWTKFTYPKVIYCSGLGRAEVTTSGKIDDAVGSFSTYAGKMNEAVETLDKVQFFGCGSGKVFISSEKVSLDFAYKSGDVYVGTEISSYLITKDFIYGDVYTMDRTQRVELDLYGNSVQVGWDGSFNLDPTTFKNYSTITLTPKWERRYYYPDCVCYQVRLVLNSTGYLALRLINLYSLSSRLANR